MATTSAAAAPTAPKTAAATIAINAHNPHPNNNLFDITFQSNAIITTTVTADPSVAAAWVITLLSSPSPPLLFGIDVEWRPNFAPKSNNPVATLQLCTRSPDISNNNDHLIKTHVCLIFQIIHCRSPLPRPLVELLENQRVTFVGAGVNADAKKLMGDYKLSVARTIELGKLANEKAVPGLQRKSMAGLKQLARCLMGVEVQKPKKVTMSRWDQRWLSHQQIQYACVDAFLSFEIGARLMGLD